MRNRNDRGYYYVIEYYHAIIIEKALGQIGTAANIEWFSIVKTEWKKETNKQVTLVATTRLTLDWTPSKHNLLLLAGFCSENYRWTYAHVQKKLYNLCQWRLFYKKSWPFSFLLRFSKTNRKRQLAVDCRCPYRPPLPTVQFCV